MIEIWGYDGKSSKSHLTHRRLRIVLDQYRLLEHLLMYWLRPESALWDAIAAKEISEALRNRGNILEVGIGNGFFSYLLFGGSFSDEFDWFYSADTSEFRENGDIFDYDAGVDIGKFICERPSQRLKYAVDHKQTLLNQATKLGFVEKLIRHDANVPLYLDGVETIYSNILYWLNDPMGVLNYWQDMLPVGGRVIISFPNNRFYQACRSYTDKSRMWRLLNRGRASSVMWYMDLAEFEKKVNQETRFRIVNARTYLSNLTLKVWDIGLRPISPALIKMANAVDPSSRLEIKREWCELMLPYMQDLLQKDIESKEDGGYNLTVLEKTR